MSRNFHDKVTVFPRHKKVTEKPWQSRGFSVTWFWVLKNIKKTCKHLIWTIFLLGKVSWCWWRWLESVKLLIVSNLFSGLMSNMFSVCKLIKLFRAWELTYRISVRIYDALIRLPFLHTVFRLKKSMTFEHRDFDIFDFFFQTFLGPCVIHVFSS